MRRIKYWLLIVIFLITLGLGTRTLIVKRNNSIVIDTISYNITQLSIINWNALTGLPYSRVPGANLGATSFQILDKNRIAFLCNSTNEVILTEKSTGKSIMKFQVPVTPRDFIFEKGIFYVLSEYEVTLFDEAGNELKKYQIPSTYHGIERLTRYNEATYLLLPTGNSLMIESHGTSVLPKEYQGVITGQGNFIYTQIIGKNSYSVKVTNLSDRTFENSYTTDKKVAGVFVVGATKNRIILDVQTYISENPITIERKITSIDFNKNGLQAIISSTKVPDCYYVISNKDFYVSEMGDIFNMVSSPQGVLIFSLTETKSEKPEGYPSTLTEKQYNTNENLIKLD